MLGSGVHGCLGPLNGGFGCLGFLDGFPGRPDRLLEVAIDDGKFRARNNTRKERKR